MESIEHVELVRLLESEVLRVFDTKRLFGYSDSLKRLGIKSVPPIGGYIPDLVYQDITGIYVIIGEAKTHNDIYNKHTTYQLKAYLSQLEIQESGILVISVQPGYEATMRSVVRTICTMNNIREVSYAVISQLERLGEV